MKFKTSASTVGLLCVLLLVTGCGAPALNFSLMSKTHEKESPQNPVEKIIPVWQEGEGPGLQPRTVSRGFSGQIYFTTQMRGLPSEVNGTVRIYVFDDQGTEEDQAKPIHQFDFDPEAWKSHMTMTRLGPAYSVFVPYTRSGRNMAECAVRIRFTPEKGTPVFSQMVPITLGGVKTTPEVSDPTKKIPIPELTEDGPQALRKVMQVSGIGNLQTQQRVKTAAYEAPAEDDAARGRVRLSHHEVKPSNPRQAFLGDDIVDLPVDEESADELIPTTVRRVRPASHVSADEVGMEEGDYEDEAPAGPPANSTIKTYTIPLED